MSAPRRSLDIYAAPQTLVSLRERRLNLHVTGEGAPTVVLAAGYLGGTLDWIFVQRALTPHARVVSFDNAGLGFSDPGPEPRTTSAIVADLHAALAAADIGPPYILVGHSAGGLRMRLFAALHPDEVAGLVMVDTVTTDWEQRLYGGPCPTIDAETSLFRRLLGQAEAGTLSPESPEFRERTELPRREFTPALNAAFVNMWLSPSYLRTAISEADALQAASQDAGLADQPLGDIPMIVLSAGRIDQSEVTDGIPERVAAWFAMHDDIAAQSTRGRRATVDAGHNIPIDAHASIVDAVLSLLPAD